MTNRLKRCLLVLLPMCSLLLLGHDCGGEPEAAADSVTYCNGYFYYEAGDCQLCTQLQEDGFDLTDESDEDAWDHEQTCNQTSLTILSNPVGFLWQAGNCEANGYDVLISTGDIGGAHSRGDCSN